MPCANCGFSGQPVNPWTCSKGHQNAGQSVSCCRQGCTESRPPQGALADSKRKVAVLERVLAETNQALEASKQALEASEQALQASQEALATTEEALRAREQALATTREELSRSEQALATMREELSRSEHIFRKKYDDTTLFLMPDGYLYPWGSIKQWIYSRSYKQLPTVQQVLEGDCESNLEYMKDIVFSSSTHKMWGTTLKQVLEGMRQVVLNLECPITMSEIEHPVSMPDLRVYETEALIQYIDRKQNLGESITSPCTRESWGSDVDQVLQKMRTINSLETKQVALFKEEEEAGVDPDRQNLLQQSFDPERSSLKYASSTSFDPERSEMFSEESFHSEESYDSDKYRADLESLLSNASQQSLETAVLRELATTQRVSQLSDPEHSESDDARSTRSTGTFYSASSAASAQNLRL